MSNRNFWNLKDSVLSPRCLALEIAVGISLNSGDSQTEQEVHWPGYVGERGSEWPERQPVPGCGIWRGR